jgi:hypothetical protein
MRWSPPGGYEVGLCIPPFSCLMTLHIDFSYSQSSFPRKTNVAEKLGPLDARKVLKLKICKSEGFLFYKVKTKIKGIV